LTGQDAETGAQPGMARRPFTWGDGGMVTNLEAESDVLLFAFGGIAGGLWLPFEFVNSTAPLGVKTVFVRDVMQSWYHRGVVGVGDDIDSVARHLADLARDSGAERTVAVGNSAGGYAALLFGRLAELDEAHAFSPQAFVSPSLRQVHADHRWEPELSDLRHSGRLHPGYADLRHVLSDPGRTSFHVYYSAAEPLDVAHAEHLAGLDGVTLHVFENGGHMLIKSLRDSGRLQSMLESALSPPPGS
jgi:hypothetical protein